MAGEYRLELHFDPISHRALLTCGSHEYLLPETYAHQDAAREAARRYAREILGLNAENPDITGPCDMPVWLR